MKDKDDKAITAYPASYTSLVAPDAKNSPLQRVSLKRVQDIDFIFDSISLNLIRKN